MKRLFSLLFFTAIAFGGFAQLTEIPKQVIPKEYGFIVEIGQQMPYIEFELTDGTTIKTSDLEGKVVMLQFTASWCGVCRKEMPHIENEIWQKHKNNKDFALFGVDMDEPVDKVIKFAEKMKITYPMALDPDANIFYTFAAKGAGITRNVIIDKSGKIVYMTRLFKQNEFDEMVEVIDLLVAPRNLPSADGEE
ncbi:MAG: TlpA family protein disulfide reductase [Draconibacterium sp.]|nr:TlpA family protein disulfide reductase [Draconibacterium sp.]